MSCTNIFLFFIGVTAIEPEWLPIYANKLCKTLKVLDEPKPRYNGETGKMHCTVNATYGKLFYYILLYNIFSYRL